MNRIRRIIAGLFLLCCATVLPAQQETTRIDSLMRYLSKNDYFSGAVLVTKDGKTIYDGAFGKANIGLEVKNKPGTVFYLCSVTKTFTSILTLQLAEKGKLKLDDPIRNYLRGCPGDSLWKKITIRQLLLHTSGIPPVYLPMDSLMIEYAHDDFARDHIFNRQLLYQPGTAATYSNMNYFLLGLIIEEVAAKKYETVLSENILAPLKMNHTGCDDNYAIIPALSEGYIHTLNGYLRAPLQNFSCALASGCMYSTTGDMLIFDRALRGDKLLSSEMEKVFFEPSLAEYPGFTYSSLGMHHVLKTGEKDSVAVSFKSGLNFGHRAIYLVSDDQRFSVILFENMVQDIQLRGSSTYSNLGVEDIAFMIVKILRGKPIDIPKVSIAAVLFPLISKGTVADGIREYEKLKTTKPGSYNFDRKELDILADELENADSKSKAEETRKWIATLDGQK